MKKGFKPRELTLLGLLTAVLLVMSWTPLGYLNIGPLAITLNMIPVAISAIALGPLGGAVTGAIFGLTSFLQCMGIGGTSAMGVATFEISPVLTFVHRFFPRLITGLLLGFIHPAAKKITNPTLAPYITGFFAAFLNTALFLSSLGLFFGNTEYVQGLLGGKNLVVGLCLMAGINAVFEMIVSPIISGLLGNTLEKARLIRR